MDMDMDMDINFFFIQFAIFLYRDHLKWDIQRTVTDLVQCFGVIDTCIEQIPKFKLSVILLIFFLLVIVIMHII